MTDETSFCLLGMVVGAFLGVSVSVSVFTPDEWRNIATDLCANQGGEILRNGAGERRCVKEAP